MHYLKNILIICCSFHSIIVYSQNNPSRVSNLDSIVSFLAIDNRIEGEYLGLTGVKSEKFKAFTRLKQLADEQTLIDLTKHHSPAVRGYAYWALVEQNSNKTYKILRKHKRDKEKIYWANGCLGGEEQLRFFMNMQYDEEKNPLNFFQQILVFRLFDKEIKAKQKRNKRNQKMN
jgi:hypothetical protein